jgi:uncharacterized phosphosugar-binding protein
MKWEVNQMSAAEYMNRIRDMIGALDHTSMSAIEEAAQAMANSVAAGRAVYYYGSGHSVLPVMDVFPRYGSFVGLLPIYDPRLIWFNVIGPGGTPELLWLEREEGYVQNVFRYYNIDSRDTLIVFSHGGLNAAGIEAAMIGKEREATVVAVTSMDNYRKNAARHSSGKKLADVADIVIDNGAPPEDALIHIPNWAEPVAASATVMKVCISMMLVAETARILSSQGVYAPTFASPNVAADPTHDLEVYDAYRRFRHRLDEPSAMLR